MHVRWKPPSLTWWWKLWRQTRCERKSLRQLQKRFIKNKTLNNLTIQLFFFLTNSGMFKSNPQIFKIIGLQSIAMSVEQKNIKPLIVKQTNFTTIFTPIRNLSTKTNAWHYLFWSLPHLATASKQKKTISNYAGNEIKLVSFLKLNFKNKSTEHSFTLTTHTHTYITKKYIGQRIMWKNSIGLTKAEKFTNILFICKFLHLHILIRCESYRNCMHATFDSTKVGASLRTPFRATL